MKIGTQDIEDIMWILAKRMPSVRINKKYSRDCSKMIFDMVLEAVGEKDVQIDLKKMFLARGGTDEQIQVHDRLCDALGFSNLQLDSKSAGVYDWIAEQERRGQKIAEFAKWAKSQERAQYIRMYRKDVENIKIDWARAFGDAEPTKKYTVII